MQSTSYEFTARAKQGPERPRLMSAWTLAGFAVVVLIPLVMVFPKQELLRQASQQRLGDVLTVNYLSNLLKADPSNLELRILLAEHRIFLDETGGIIELIEPAIFSNNPEWQAKGLLMEYKFLTRRFQLSAPHSPRHEELREWRAAAFMKLQGRKWPLPTLVYLAGQADELHEHGVSALLHRTITESAAMMPSGWFVETARRTLAEGNHELAARLYFIARHKEHTLAKQREYLLAGVHALMDGGLFAEAMRAVDQHVDNLEDDTDTLYALVQAARAANDQPRAVRYAKRLLHLSWVGQIVAWLQRLDLGLIGISNADAASEMPQAAADNIRAYDKKNYELGYQVFIENNNLNEAFRVAEAAVRQSPSETIWHQRLAQIAEWLGKPEVALREWRWLLRHRDTQEALLAVLRLAPVMNDSDALLDAWKRVAAKQKLDEAQWKNLADLFEQTGRQREGIKFFEARYAAERQAFQLETAARLAERSGDDERAAVLYGRLFERHGARTDWLMKIANLHLRKGEYRKAYDLLQSNRAKVGEDDIAYWKLLADLAWQLQLDKDAKKNYRRMAEAGKLAREDFSRLIYLLGDARRDEKAALAELGYRRFGDRDMLLLALEIHAANGDRQAQKRLFESAAADRKLDLSDSSRFYLLRAQYLQANGDFRAARADSRHAAGIAPDSVSSGNAMLWFLIDAHDLPALREMIARLVARGDHENPDYWGALAAAYQVLDQPARAAAYYARQLKHSGQDFLWLVNYADALEQARQAGMAARVRRHAWLKLRRNLSGKPVALSYAPDMLAAARLSMLNAPGDPASALVRSVLRQDRLLKHEDVAERTGLAWAVSLKERDADAERMTSDLVLGWAVSTEQSANAKAWLWQRYGRMLGSPLWAATSVAVAENDTEQLGHLLDGQADGMSMLVRHDAANATEQERYAQSIVFDGLTDDPENNEAHQRLSEDMLAAAGEVGFELRSEQLGTLHNTVQSVHIETALNRHLRVAAEFRKTRQSDDTASTFGALPPTERIAGLALKNHSGFGATEIALRRRNEFARTTEMQVSHAMDIVSRVNLRFGLELNAAATESNELRVFGMRDQVSTGLLYRFGKRESVHVQPAWARYYTQGGEYLGSGRQLAWELGHQLRIDAPDLKVRLTGIHTDYNNADAASLPLPEKVNIYGLCFGYGEAYRNGYTRAWQPSADYCATHNDSSGRGYNASLGLNGPLAGHDQLALGWRQESGGANVLNGLSRELTLNYRYFY
ncbi:MAG: tetratricopeptide repeat protein [Sideroxyarcus sp.]|nr:tetratricopeptide repeat protein [Sideroxyarcus sp.]